MGKFVLILVLGASAAGLHHALSVNEGARGAAVQSAERAQLVLARAAAQTGWARAKHELMIDFQTTTLDGTNEGIPYTTTAVVTGDRALITSTGRTPRLGASGETAYRLVYAIRKNPALTPVPRFMRYALLSDGDMSFGGSSDVVRPGIAGRAADTLAIRVHTNGRLQASGSSAVHGFGTYRGGIAPGTERSFDPVYNPLGLPVVAPALRVPVPAVNPDSLVAEDGIDYDYPAGTSLTNRTVPGGTRLEPAIYRFRGAVTLSNLTVSGYAVFVADGDVTVSGVVRGETREHTGPQESALALYTPGTVRMGGNATVHAQIVAGQGVQYSGTVSIHGSLVVGGSYSQTGNATIFYVPASPGLTQGFTGRPDPGFTLLAVREQ